MDLSARRTATERDWAALPWDVLTAIFERIEVVWIIVSVQAVCRQWRKFSLQPHLWRHIYITDIDILMFQLSLVKDDLNIGDKRTVFFSNVVGAAVNRSKGQLVSLTVRDLFVDRILKLVAERATELEELHLISCGAAAFDTLRIEAPFDKLSSLKELTITRCTFESTDLEFIFQMCPNVESLCLNLPVGDFPGPRSYCNRDLFAIAKTMTRLRELEISCYRPGHPGMLAVLDCCPDLEYIDLSQCAQLKYDDELREKCKRLSVLGLPIGDGCDLDPDAYEEYDDYISENDDYDDHEPCLWF